MQSSNHDIKSDWLLRLLAAGNVGEVPLGLLSRQSSIIASARGQSGVAAPTLEEHLETLGETSVVELGKTHLVVSEDCLLQLRPDLERTEIASGLETLMRAVQMDLGDVVEFVVNWDRCAEIESYAVAIVEQYFNAGFDDSPSGEILLRLARSKESRGQYLDALSCLRLHAERKPTVAGSLEEADLHSVLGLVLDGLGDHDRAESELRTALEMLPDNGTDARVLEVRARAILSLSSVLIGCGSSDDARSLLAPACKEERRAGTQDWLTAHMLANLSWSTRLTDAEAALQSADDAVQLLGSSDISDPLVCSHVFSARAHAFDELKRPEEAQKDMEYALQIIESAIGDEHPEIGILQSNLGTFLLSHDHPQEALPHLEAALATGEGTLVSGHRSLWSRHRRLAEAQSKLGNSSLELSHLTAALAISRRAVGESSIRFRDDLEELGFAQERARDYDDAFSSLSRVVEIDTIAKDRNPLTRAYIMMRSGRVAAKASKFTIAISRLTEAAELARAGDGAKDRDAARVAATARVWTWHALTQIHADFEAYEPDFDTSSIQERMSQLIATDREKVVRDWIDIADSELLTSIAAAAFESGDVGFSASMLNAATPGLLEEGEGSANARSNALWLWISIAPALLRESGEAEAEKALDTALGLAAGDPINRSIVMHELGLLSAALDDDPEAIRWLQKAVQELTPALDDQSELRRCSYLGSLTTVHLNSRNSLEAQDCAKERVDSLVRLPGSTKFDLGVALRDAAKVFSETGDNPTAIAYLQRALALASDAESAREEELTEAQHRLGRLLLEEGEIDQARDAFEQLVSTLNRGDPVDHHFRGVAMHDLGTAFLAGEDPQMAISCYRLGIEIKGRAFPPDRLDIGRTQLMLSKAYLADAEASEAKVASLDAIDSFRAAEVESGAEFQMALLTATEALLETQDAESALAQIEAAYQASELVAPASFSVEAMRVRALEELGEPAKASRAREKLLDEILSSDAETGFFDHLDSAFPICHAVGGLEAAVALCARAKLLVDAGSSDHVRATARALLALGRAQLSAARVTEAISSFESRLSLLNGLPDPDRRLIGVTYHDLGLAYEAANDFELAVEAFEKACAFKRDAIVDGKRADLDNSIVALAKCAAASGDHDLAVKAITEFRELSRDPKLVESGNKAAIDEIEASLSS